MTTPTPVRLARAAAEVGGRPVWSQVDLDIAPGEFHAVVGSNGAGKSTLLHVLLGHHPLAAGCAEVLGRPPGRAGRDVGYLPQRRSFDSSMRVRGVDLVRLGLDGHRLGVPLPGARWVSATARARRARVDAAVDLVGATGFARRPIGELSGGEQQRVLIAQALVSLPPLLLLDEPLDGLDRHHQHDLAVVLARICADEGVAVVMVSHDLAPIAPHLHGVTHLIDGRARSGRPEDVDPAPTGCAHAHR